METKLNFPLFRNLQFTTKSPVRKFPIPRDFLPTESTGESSSPHCRCAFPARSRSKATQVPFLRFVVHETRDSSRVANHESRSFDGHNTISVLSASFRCRRSFFTLVTYQFSRATYLRRSSTDDAKSRSATPAPQPCESPRGSTSCVAPAHERSQITSLSEIGRMGRQSRTPPPTRPDFARLPVCF